MRIILLLIAAYLVYRFISKRRAPEEKPRHGEKTFKGGGGEKEETVFDEVCRTYVPRDFALKIGEGENTHFFCSENCREKWKELKG
ncbi:MAG: hypothetical protein HY883_03090 [Deltaproteobacteria bacterium]|nr:hypothetical protein [Deltaproteobacteria bacterium]